jgi:tRNA 2-thiouridine synthesizing protein A
MTVVLKPDRVLDCRGQSCPAPVLRAREEIDRLQSGQVLQVLASDAASREDISRWARRTGHALLELREERGELSFLIRKK